MLCKTIIEGLGLIDVNFEPFPYQIVKSMGGSKKTYGLTKHEVVI
jgi:hypothetical protein